MSTATISPPANELHEGKGKRLFIQGQISKQDICIPLKINRSIQAFILLRGKLFDLVISHPVAALQGLKKKKKARKKTTLITTVLKGQSSRDWQKFFLESKQHFKSFTLTLSHIKRSKHFHSGFTSGLQNALGKKVLEAQVALSKTYTLCPCHVSCCCCFLT